MYTYSRRKEPPKPFVLRHVAKCPVVRTQTTKCFRLCRPEKDGMGPCGRLAPHGMKSAIQKAIANHKRAN